MKQTLCLLISILLMSINSFGQAITYNGSLCQGKTTTLTVSGAAAGTSFQWRENGINKSGANQSSLVINTAGIYDVILNPASANPDTLAEVTIAVKPNPVAQFNALPSGQCGNVPVSFTNTSTGTGLSYAWDFGDLASGGSNTSTQAAPTHRFEGTPGNNTQNFAVKLTVTNSDGCTDDATVTVNTKQLPDMLLGGNGASMYDGKPYFRQCTGVTSSNFTFTNLSTTTGTNTSYRIIWGDNSADYSSSAFAAPVNHTFNTGTTEMLYIIGGNNGCTDTIKYHVFVGSNPAVSLGNPGNTTICTGDSLTFPIPATNNPLETIYTVRFNDGSAPVVFPHPAPGSITHTFLRTSCGTTSSSTSNTYINSFSASIEASNPCQSSSASVVPIYVSEKSNASFSISPKDTVCVNTIVTHTNNSGTASYIDNGGCINGKVIWTVTPTAGRTINGDLGDDFGLSDPANWRSGDQSLVIRYTTPGVYNVKLKTGNLLCGVVDTIRTICVNPTPAANFTIQATEGCAPFMVNATNNSPAATCGSNIYQWSVTYNNPQGCTPNGASFQYLNGTNAASENPQFQFDNPGMYTISLTTISPGGVCSSQVFSRQITVKAPPAVSFAAPPTICQNGSFTPSAVVGNCYVTTAATYQWTFAGGTPASSTQANPGSISYNTAGTYTITLDVTNECGTTTVTRQITVNPAPDVTVPAALSLCAGDATGSLSFSSTLPGTSFTWTNNNTSIGLAGSGSGNISSFTVSNPGAVPVMATIAVTPNNNGCPGPAQSFTITVNPKPPAPSAASPVAYCLNATAAPLTATAAAGHTLTWYPDATLTNGSAIAPTPITTVAGITNYYVTQSAGGCASAVTQITVTVLPGITGNAIGADQDICTGNAAATLTDAATIGGGSGVYLYQWQSSTDGGANWSAITGANSATYNPGALTATTLYRRSVSSGACTDNLSNVVTITVQGALTNFDISGAQAICAGATPTALDGQTPVGTGGASAFQWQSSPDGTTWTNIAGATGEDYQPTALSASTYYQRITTNGSCTAVSSAVLITVNATPVMTTIADAFYCNNAATPIISFTSTPSANIVYNWTNSNTAIGLGTSGTGAIASFTTINNSPSKLPESSRIEVTPYNTANGLNCMGSVAFFNITILPTIALQAINDTTVCSGATVPSVTPINDAGAVQGASVNYTWTVAGSGASLTAGSGNAIPAFTTSNPGTADLITTITVTPQYSFGGQTCAGTPVSYNVTVKPATPVANAGPDAPLCAAATYTMQGSPTGAATGLWTQVSGPAATITNAALPNTTIAGLQVANTYVFEWTVTGYSACPPTSDQVTIQVFSALVNTIDVTPQVICFGQTINITGGAPTGGNGSYTYQWQYSPDGTAWTDINGQAAQALSFTPTQSGFVRRRVISLPCDNESAPATITVQPAVSNNAISADQSICINTQPALISGALPTGANGVFVYQWQQSVDGGATWANINGATTQDYTPPVLTATTTYQRIVSSSLCTGPQSSISNRITITVNPDAEALFTYAADTACAPFVINTSVLFLQDMPAKNSTYEWYANGVLIGTGASFPGYTISNGHDSVLIKLKAISRFGCKADSMEHWFFTVMEPVPDFTLSTNSGCGPLQVQITNNTASASLFRFYWTFGDGQTSTAAQPGFITLPPSPFFTDTTYIITLHAISPCDTITLSKSVLVKSIPKSLFTPNKTVGCSPLAVTFNNTSLGRSSLYTWAFGDGATAVTNAADTISHTFITGVLDTFFVSLKAENECGADSLQYAIVVSPNRVFLDFAVNGNEQAGCAPHTVRFINNTRGATSFRWDFGDGNILSTTKNIDTITHTYQQAGIFNVTLFATNGCSDTSTTEAITVYPKPIAAFAASEYMPCIGDSVRFSNVSDSATTYLWSFGDSVTSTLVNPVHQYRATGVYIVTLKSFRTNIPGLTCSDSISQQINIVSSKEGWFDATDTASLCAPLTATFTNRNIPATSATWDFGDGTTGSGNVVTHTYANAGTYIVTLTAIAPQGCTYITTRTIQVSGPSGVLQYNGGFLCNDASARLQVVASNTDSVLWNFGDGTFAVTTGNVVFHRYDNGGSYIPSATLISRSGCRILLQGLDTIKADKIKAGFTAAQQQTCGFTDVSFKDTTKAYYGGVTSLWNFGDGTTGSGNFIVHTYTATGAYPLQLIVTSNISGCADTLVKSLPVKVNDKPEVSIIAGATGCTNSNTVFRSAIQAIDSIAFINWTLSNGARSSGPVFTYNFTQPGTYTAQLIVGTVYGCFDTATHTITVNASPNVTASTDETLCLGGSAQLQASGAPQFSWAPLQGLSCTTCADPIVTPLVTTTYIVRGTNAAGCTDDDTVLVTVIQPMNMRVSANDSICIGQSTLLQASGAASYVWLPAAGLSSTVISNPVASPTATTIYRVVGYDGFNCFTDTAFVTVAIGQYPVISLGPDVTLSTGTLHPLATSVQNGPIRNWLWSPATDLSCATCPLPVANIKKDIAYIVRGTTAYGCSDTDTISIKVFCENTQLFIPNAFSPDGDGVNDILMVRGKGIAAVKTFRIFNRWGEVVFEKSSFAPNDPAHGWNGKIKGVVGGPDVYVYTADVICENGTTYTYQGNVSIIR